MTINVTVLLFALAAVCFIIAALSVPTRRLNLVAAGLFFWVFELLLHAAGVT